MFLNFAVVDFVTTNYFFQIFVTSESCYRFILKNFFECFVYRENVPMFTTLLIFGRD